MLTDISIEKTLDILKKYAKKIELKSEKVDLKNVKNRFISQTLKTKYNFPPFNRAAMDGYAIQFKDIQSGIKKFKIIESIYAGDSKKTIAKSGIAIKIMTGAPVPLPFDTVIMYEHALVTEDGYVSFTKLPKKHWENIALKGEDIHKGQIILKKGTLIKNLHINLLGACGFAKVPVFKMLKIGIIATGSELVPISREIYGAQIRNSSSYTLMNQIAELSEFKDYGIVKDKKYLLKKKILKAVNENDIILITGGASHGEKDFTLPVLKDLKAKLIFEKIKIKPGRPTIFAMLNNKFIFGLPGNPVSTFTIFEIFIKSLIHFINNDFNYTFPLLVGKITFNIKKKNNRPHFIPIIYKVENQKIILEKVKYNGSGDFSALSRSNGMALLPQNYTEIKEGYTISFIPFL